jgi:hypothetical protein
VDAAMELGILPQGEALAAGDAFFLLRKLNRIIDNWNADRQAVTDDQFLSFTLTPSLNPHTIGPTLATWDTTRPVSVEGVQLTIGSSGTLELMKRTAAWFQALTDPTLTSETPTDFYYNPTWPNGSLYLYPVPSAAYVVQLLVRGIIAGDYELDEELPLAPGYRDALTLTLAEESLAAYGSALTPTLVQRLMMSATNARARIFANNTTVPKLVTTDAGMPGGGPAWFDYRTGGFTQ